MGARTDREFDVVIVGGGLAGLTLARQLNLEAPGVRAIVCETRPHPVREAAFKVGESTVEIGAHYFQNVLGLESHLRSNQLEKLGLRYFFPDGFNRDLATRVEVGPAAFPRVPSFQLDRGRFENMLLQAARATGTHVLDGCTVQQITLGLETHRVSVSTPAGRRDLTARWVVDGSGRRGLLKRQLGLARKSSHKANACWFRVRERIKVDDWSDDPAWLARVPSKKRWLSTTHLMGIGYWAWLIPLGSGGTSLGIVADATLHPFNRLNRFERAVDWLHEFEPQFADVLASLGHQIEDFLALQHYAHGCAQVFSGDRWALVGEAGVFTDPFYSPGSDFIAIGNECVADLIARDVAGEPVSERAAAFNATYLRLFDAFVRLYDGQYPIMGNAQVMTAKISWDNACYWGIVALLYFQRRFRQPAFIASIEPLMRRFFLLHARMQQFLRVWSRADDASYANAAASVIDVEWLRRLQDSVDDAPMDDARLRARLEDNYARLEEFARSWQAVASALVAGLPETLPPGTGDVAVDLTKLVFAPQPSNARITTAESLPPKARDVETPQRMG